MMRQTVPMVDNIAPRHSLSCRSCRSTDVVEVLDLGQVPASDVFPPVDAPTPDDTWPLQLFICRDCALLQLGPATELPPEQPGPVDSSTALAHAAASVTTVVDEERLHVGQTFCEYDSGHGGSWAQHFIRAGLRPVVATSSADLVVDVHNLMHELDLDAVLAARARQVAPGGVLVAEFFHGLPMVEQTLIDTIRHGHYVYLTLTAALPALARQGLIVTRATTTSAYGGSLRISARRAEDDPGVHQSVAELLQREHAAGVDGTTALDALLVRTQSLARRVRTTLEGYAATGSRVAGYGAPSKAPVLLALTGVNTSLLPYTVDRSPAKHGRRVPGAGVPIHPIERLLKTRPDVVVVLTWDIADEIADQLSALSRRSGWTPRLFVPLPEPHEIPLGAVRTQHAEADIPKAGTEPERGAKIAE